MFVDLAITIIYTPILYRLKHKRVLIRPLRKMTFLSYFAFTQFADLVLDTSHHIISIIIVIQSLHFATNRQSRSLFHPAISPAIND